jgi:hypothetical protein
MLVQFSRFPHGFDLLEGNIHEQDMAPNTKLKMSNTNERPFIQASLVDPIPPPWGILLKTQASINHFVH